MGTNTVTVRVMSNCAYYAHAHQGECLKNANILHSLKIR